MRRILGFLGAASIAGVWLMLVLPAAAAGMPSPTVNVLGMGTTLGGCVFPKPMQGEPADCTTAGDPPAPSGAAGPNDYVEVTTSGYAVWDKSGTLIQHPAFINTLWTGYPTSDGNACATTNDGDGVVRYDRLADRWIIAQFDVHNFSTNSTPAYECVAVSKTGDPTGGAGAWWRYDFQYAAEINDYSRLGIWPDAYYMTYDLFGAASHLGPDVCALNRAAILTGPDGLGGVSPNTAAQNQQCFSLSSGAGVLVPADLDGPVPPPVGSREYVLSLGSNNQSVNLWKFHVDWAHPANSSLTGPTSIPVTAFTTACHVSAACITQPAPGNALRSLGDRLMDRVAYRNFGDHESLVLNHSVDSGATVGIRWYEIRDPGGSPTVQQQGTYAPADGGKRWMGAVAQDQAGDMVLGYSLSSATQKPSVAWTGRLAGDPAGQMPQAESIVESGPGVESGTYSDGQPADAWGFWSSMSIDPSDDCTFWYANEYYPSNGIFNWDTRIAAVKFPGCAANDFSISPAASTVTMAAAGQRGTLIATTVTAGAANQLALNVSGLPAGLTASFSPSSVNSGQSSTLTITGNGSTPVGSYPVYVVGTGASAYHGKPLTVDVVADDPPSCTDVNGLSTPYQTALHVALNCTDPNAGDTLAYAVVSPPSHGSLSGIDSTGHLTFTPHSGYVGPDSFTVKSTDQDGLESNLAQVSLTVGAPMPPKCNSQAVAVRHATAKKLTLGCSHPASTSIHWVIVTKPTHGTLSSVGPQGAVTYVPGRAYTGPDSFKFKAVDNHGGSSSVATVTLHVAAAVRPVCGNQALTVSHNTSRKITLRCTRPAGTTLRWVISNRPAHGRLSRVDAHGVVTYTPNRGYHGRDGFSFKAVSSQGASSKLATVALSVRR